MIVDDSLTVRKVTQKLLLREGWEVLMAKDGIDASRLVKKGYSKDKPLDPAKTDEARMKNRRVEITYGPGSGM